MGTRNEAVQTAPSCPAMKPGIYRGGSAAVFGLWRLREDGVWLFSVPVDGSTWKIAANQTGEDLVLLADETTN